MFVDIHNLEEASPIIRSKALLSKLRALFWISKALSWISKVLPKTCAPNNTELCSSGISREGLQIRKHGTLKFCDPIDIVLEPKGIVLQ